jgi:hypothetical protein
MAYATNSLGNYSGTIVSSPIRPFGPNETIATVFSNEIKGGHHNYELLSERDALITERRDWGMLVTVYNDPSSSNNKTYKLEYGFVNTNLSDNSNWVVYNPSGNTSLSNSEWVDSVQEKASFPTVFTDGYRYLVDQGAITFFTGQDGKVAVYNSAGATFTFYEPSNGLTLRIDTHPNILYRYSGTFSSGSWVTEILNSVRYLDAVSVDGITYSATSSQALLRDFYDSVYYINFNPTSSGTVSLIIDGLTASQIYKLENNSLSLVSSNDLRPGIQYQLIWNGTSFQTTLPSSSTTTIGTAEDSDYTDGLFTDFVPSTPIGTAIDRFNEVLKNLVPSPGPTLSSWSSVGSFVNGGLSFDNTTGGGLITATQSPYSSVASGETFSNIDSPYRLGITSKFVQPITGTQFFQDISGILNVNVPQSTQTPLASYVTYSFGSADIGTLSLYLNGFTVSTVGLTGGIVDTTSAGATSGLNISAQTASLFPSGVYFEPHQNRTATYLIKNDCDLIVDGYNYIIIQHLSNTFDYTLSRYEFVSDPSTNDVVVSSPEISSVITNSSNNKFLSGIEFFNTPTDFIYTATVQNLFENTFNQDSDAIKYTELSSIVSSVTNSVTATTTNGYTNSIFSPVSTSSFLIPNGSYTPTQTMLINMTYSLNTGIRRIDDSIAFGLVIKRTVQGTFTGGTALNTAEPTDNWFIDSVLPSSSTSSESFDDENFRLVNGTSKYNTYNYTSDITSGVWSSLASILNDVNHFNGLQVINGILIYPNFNFSNPGPGSTNSNPNYNIGSTRNYSNCSAFSFGFGTYSGAPPTPNRTWTRWYFFGATGSPVSNYSSGRLRIYHDNVSFVNNTVPLEGGGSNNPNTDVWVEIKLPYDSGVVPGGTMSTGAVTGWLDATKPFSNLYEDGDGCLSGTVPTASGGEWLIDFGIKGTEFSGGYVLLRVTSGRYWSSHITGISFEPYP